MILSTAAPTDMLLKHGVVVVDRIMKHGVAVNETRSNVQHSDYRGSLIIVGLKAGGHEF
jgi:hypothetical protein